MYDVRHTANGTWKQGPRILAALLLALLLPASAHVANAQPPPDSTVAPAAPPATAPVAPPAPTSAPPADVTQAAAAAGGTIRADANADTLPDADGGWPRLIPCPSGATMILYQPQLLSWQDQRQLVAMCAVSYTPKGATKADLGTIRLESATSTSVEERMVNLVKVDVTSMNFQSLEKLETQEVLAEIKKSLPKENMLVALDRILAAADSSMLSAKSVKINTEPPPIFYSTKDAILVQFDGEPIFVPIETTSLNYVVNTNWDVFKDANTHLFLLRNDTYWIQSADLKTWEPVQKLPEGFEKLANDDNWKDVKANIPGKKISKGKMPVVFVSKTPAELILIDGSPKFEQVKPTKLRWIKNTESDLFRYDGKNKKKTYYVLLSGRWFRTDDPEKAPWTFATNDLPDDFPNIPRDHERARVLSSVPGTAEAAQAILLASVPRTAQVDAKNLKPPDVKYDGNPTFKPIPGTSVSYAENSPFDVLKVGDTYYLCFQAVWFKSSSPAGPFTVATQVPPEIYTIPADSPAQHVTYVTVIDDDDDYPTYGYTAGYVGVSIAFGCAMWGTGYYYPPYYHGGMYLPAARGVRRRHGVQPVDRRVRRLPGRVRSLRRRRARRCIQSQHRHLRARRHGVGSGRRQGLRPGLQPAHRHLRLHAPGQQRVRKLGLEPRAARRQLGQHPARDRRAGQFQVEGPGERRRRRGGLELESRQRIRRTVR
jgi:hypothetical protein